MSETIKRAMTNQIFRDGETSVPAKLKKIEAQFKSQAASLWTSES